MGCKDGHDWEPAANWSGRYRCQTCFVFGHRLTSEYDSVVIKPYPCSVKKCGAGAVTKTTRSLTGMGTKRWFCARHRPDK